MDPARARAMAEQLHLGHRGATGEPLLSHLRRVATAVPERARAVAWLHEALERTPIAEEELLVAGLSPDELRALRLLTRSGAADSYMSYIAHIRFISRATGTAAELARTVKRADLEDRVRHPQPHENGWSPPYGVGLSILQGSVTT